MTFDSIYFSENSAAHCFFVRKFKTSNKHFGWRKKLFISRNAPEDHPRKLHEFMELAWRKAQWRLAFIVHLPVERLATLDKCVTSKYIAESMHTAITHVSASTNLWGGGGVGVSSSPHVPCPFSLLPNRIPYVCMSSVFGSPSQPEDMPNLKFWGTLCSDFTNTQVGISGETFPEGRNLHIYWPLSNHAIWWAVVLTFEASMSHHTPPPLGGTGLHRQFLIFWIFL